MQSEDLLAQLRHTRTILETHYRDMCDFEFTVEQGKLYVLSARPGKRTAMAAIRIATDLFVEGQITGSELLRRIAPQHVQDLLRPVMTSNEGLCVIGTGIGGSTGIGSGVAVFSADLAVTVRSKGKIPIILTNECTPDDIHGMEVSGGIVSFLGGKSSHAAVVARGMGRPCVVNTGWRFDDHDGVITSSGVIHEGDALTIDGTAGIVYSGAAILQSPNPLENERLVLIVKLIDALASEAALPDGFIGSSWRIRDMVFHRLHAVDEPDCRDALKAWPVKAGESVALHTCNHFATDQVEVLSSELRHYAVSVNRSDQSLVWFGMRHCLLRLLSKYVGVGRHPNFYRPLFDPCQAVLPNEASATWGCREEGRIQFVGEEFFSINHFVPDYLELGSVRIYAAVECQYPNDLWRIDRTNPLGEKLLDGTDAVRALKVVVNDACVPLSELPAFYNYFRRKEYFWKWYAANGISRQEIIGVLGHHARGMRASRIQAKLVEAGLLTDEGSLTSIGESLRRPTTAVARARECLRIGW